MITIIGLNHKVLQIPSEKHPKVLQIKPSRGQLVYRLTEIHTDLVRVLQTQKTAVE